MIHGGNEVKTSWNALAKCLCCGLIVAGRPCPEGEGRRRRGDNAVSPEAVFTFSSPISGGKLERLPRPDCKQGQARGAPSYFQRTRKKDARVAWLRHGRLGVLSAGNSRLLQSLRPY